MLVNCESQILSVISFMKPIPLQHSIPIFSESSRVGRVCTDMVCHALKESHFSVGVGDGDKPPAIKNSRCGLFGETYEPKRLQCMSESPGYTRIQPTAIHPAHMNAHASTCMNSNLQGPLGHVEERALRPDPRAPMALGHSET
jgi:hypothetical protein